MGEIVDLSTGLGSSLNIISGLASVAALGIFALVQDGNDDDDDSTPGGGLMQPVA
jgi:hypothetical protein